MTPTAKGNLQPGNVHTDTVITGLTMEYQYPDLVGEFFAPLTPVANKTDIYPIFYGGDENIEYETARGPGGAFNEVDFSAHQDTFNCEGHGLENKEPWETKANADPAWQQYLDAGALGARLRHLVMLKHERKVVTAFNTDSNYASGHYYQLSTTQFNDSGVNGYKRLLDEVRNLRLKVGGAPIAMAVTGDCYNYMLTDSNFIPALSGNVLANINQLANNLGISEVRVVNTLSNTAQKGQAETRTAMWTANSIWLFVRSANGSRMAPSAAKTFQWTNNGVVRGGQGIRTGTNDEQAVDWMQFVKYYDVKLTGIDTAGKIITATWLKDVYQT